MTGRFEVLTLGEGQCLIRVCGSDDTVLLATNIVPGLDLAESTIDWLRSALQRDWLYQIGRAYQGNGPMFTLAAPFGVVCSSPPFSSSDSMERAIAYLKATVVAAPVLKLSAARGGRVRAPSAANLTASALAPIAALSHTVRSNEQN